MIAKLIELVLPLGLYTFAVVAALGMIGTAPATRLRVSVLLTAFEAGMPLIGLALEAPLGHAIGKTPDYLAIGVLLSAARAVPQRCSSRTSVLHRAQLAVRPERRTGEL